MVEPPPARRRRRPVKAAAAEEGKDSEVTAAGPPPRLDNSCEDGYRHLDGCAFSTPHGGMLFALSGLRAG